VTEWEQVNEGKEMRKEYWSYFGHGFVVVVYFKRETGD
jgi:hypothetical protein